MKKLFLLVGVIAAMISCAQNDVYDVNESNPDVIAFDTYVDQTTKGTIFDQSAVQVSGFGLMTYYTEQSYWADGAEEFTPNYMYNQEVVYSGSAWSYSPIKYWPNLTGDKLSFFAYAPYQTYVPEDQTAEVLGNGVNATYTANDAAGLPQIQFFVNPVASKMIDFVAGQNMDMVRQDDKVTFNLKHQLTRVTFSAITNVDNVDKGANEDGDGASYIVVKSMDIVEGDDDNLFYTEGIYTFDDETTNGLKSDHGQDGVWTINTDSATPYSFASIMDYNNVSTTALYGSGYKETGVVLPIASDDYTSLFTTGQYLFLLPPAGADGLDSTDGTIDVKIVYDIVTVDSQMATGHTAAESTFVVTLPEGTLAQGKAYNFQLQFDVTEILVNVKIVDWDEASSNSSVVDPDGGNSGEEEDDKPEVEVTPGKLIPGNDYILNEDGETYALPGMIINGTHEIDVTSDPEEAITWSSSNEAVATVDENGKVTAIGVGETVITGTTESGAEISFTLTVYYRLYDAIYTMVLSPGSLDLIAGGDTGKMEVVYTYQEGIIEKYIEPIDLAWSSTFSTYATVSDGIITPIAAGITYIQAIAIGSISGNNPGTGYGTVTVTDSVVADPITLAITVNGNTVSDGDTVTIFAGQTFEYTATASDGSIVTRSSSGSIGSSGQYVDGVVCYFVTGKDAAGTGALILSINSVEVATINFDVITPTVAITSPTTSLTEGDEDTIAYTSNAFVGSSVSIVYSSSNPTVATISSTGEIEALSAGTTTITVAMVDADGNTLVSDSYELTVAAAAEPVGIIWNGKTYTDGGTISIMVSPGASGTFGSDSTDGITWASSNTDLVTIDASTGDFTILSTVESGGSTNITATCNGVITTIILNVGIIGVDGIESGSGNVTFN